MEWFGPAFSWALSKMSTRVSARPLRCQRRENRHRAAEARRPRITTCSQLLAAKHPFLLKSAERLLAQFSSRAPALSSRATHAAGVVAAEYSAVVAVLAPMRGHLTRDERAPLLPSSRQQPFLRRPPHTRSRESQMEQQSGFNNDSRLFLASMWATTEVAESGAEAAAAAGVQFCTGRSRRKKQAVVLRDCSVLGIALVLQIQQAAHTFEVHARARAVLARSSVTATVHTPTTMAGSRRTLSAPQRWRRREFSPQSNPLRSSLPPCLYAPTAALPPSGTDGGDASR